MLSRSGSTATLVHNNPVDRPADDYQDRFPVTLKQGYNTLLVAVYERAGGWSGFFGFVPGAEYTVIPPGSVTTDSNAPIIPAWDVNEDGKNRHHRPADRDIRQ